ncbi:MAG: hypothetical protein K0R94_1359, partial [Burkholderiales bacterium]|nr:hypothetical protein [Burkholderiales bacterium]
GNLVIGGGSLFFMGLGTGLPLLLIAVFGNKLLPKSGKWMEAVKYCFAYLMLLMAIYISSRLLNGDWVKILCGGLLLIITLHLIAATVKQSINSKKISIIMMLIAFTGAVYLVTIASKSLYGNNIATNKKNTLQFQVVDNKHDLEAILSNANKNMPVILDFSASWCLACKEMELTTFSDSRIIGSLMKYTRIRVDVTSNSPEIQKIEKAYGVFAPPSLVFIGQNGKVDNKSMVTGYIDADKLHKILQDVK